ncbi:cytochrome c oxidase subunit 3 [Aquiflexum balticum DSM 16537]|jgi:cytochrome c oxidase subunit III|uniref:Cytochrome c oxidase subunit 3 n=1 Tax=Aquiflexum balticum DSM 16537 TaxID=758820 RepID=A0A1W2H3Q9_9BACT|nr:cytochrome c oxidase subunit 3 [Aquiflexum balticum]SMD43575.1 cytochrome c oxidase subunit 3 [Aquiflexum balticum DSM 16537]
MSTTATAIGVSPKRGTWGGGNEPLKASYGKLMMWFFLLSDIFTFAALLITYISLRVSFPAYDGPAETFVGSNEYWPVPELVFDAIPFIHGVHIPLAFVGLMTFILIMSSVTMVLAVEAGHRNDKNDVVKWLLWTLLGGITFLSCQAWEWSHFIHGTEAGSVMTYVNNLGQTVTGVVNGANLSVNEYGPSNFAQLFFFITGFHGFHVTLGVVLLFLAFYQAAVGVYEGRGHYEMVEKIGLYWHFVDLVWVFVFTLFYLI